LELLVEDQIPEGVLAVWIAVEIIEAEFLEDASLAKVREATGAIGATDRDSALAGGVATEDGAVVHEDGIGSMSGCG
jgi:hypothetical protein